jgi:hypothetical protein
MKLTIECPFCSRLVSVNEPAFSAVYVCPHCGVQFSRVYSLAKRDTDFTAIAELLADELKRDVSYIMGLGIKLEKGKLAAKTGGLGWAGYEAFTGDWLTSLLAGGLSLLAGSLTDAYNRIKVQEMRQKWFEILNSYSETELSCLMGTIRRRHPLLLPQVQGLLQTG